MRQSEGRSPWFYVGAGCGCLALVAVVAVTLLVWSGARMVNNIKGQLSDPEVRAHKALELLGADELPDGYFANLSLSVPLFGSFVILSDQQDPQHAAAGTFFIYMRSRMLAGKTDTGVRAVEDPESVREILKQQGFELEHLEKLGGGSFESGPQKISFASFLGTFREKGRRSSAPVVATLASIRCPGDSSVGRIGLWILPLADPPDLRQRDAAATRDTAVTEGSQEPSIEPKQVAPDVGAVQAFLAPFDFCRN